LRKDFIKTHLVARTYQARLQQSCRLNDPSLRKITLIGDGRHSSIEYSERMGSSYIGRTSRGVEITERLIKKDYYSFKLRTSALNTQTGTISFNIFNPK
jgi:hypothetical protein